jgi:hypothetical protein
MDNALPTTLDVLKIMARGGPPPADMWERQQLSGKSRCAL